MTKSLVLHRANPETPKGPPPGPKHYQVLSLSAETKVNPEHHQVWASSPKFPDPGKAEEKAQWVKMLTLQMLTQVQSPEPQMVPLSTARSDPEHSWVWSQNSKNSDPEPRTISSTTCIHVHSPSHHQLYMEVCHTLTPPPPPPGQPNGSRHPQGQSSAAFSGPIKSRTYSTV